MTALIIVLIIVLILSLLIVPFTRDLMKDKQELSQTTIDKKFEVMLGIINQGLMHGTGKLKLFADDKKWMNMYSDEHRNMLIQFFYSTGNLTITLKYKWLQKEMVFSRQFNGLRNISIFTQKNIANEFVELGQRKIVEHQKKCGFEDVSSMRGGASIHSESDPTSMISDMYEDLSMEQKKSLVNFLYVLGRVNGSNEPDIIATVGFAQTILYLGTTFESCKEQLQKYGESKIYQDLTGIDDAIVSVMIMSVAQMLPALSKIPGTVERVQEQKMADMFAKIGYDEERMNDVVQKIELMSKMFGM